MDDFLNPHRPPAFCPGCGHDRSARALDRAFRQLALEPHQVALVTDIGCSGLFDVFFRTHAFHGLHGRALTYAAGVKLTQPHLRVVAVMGDGGLGIGAAHVQAACRRNLNLTLLVLNNFNFGMTGGQYSCTTFQDASMGTFLHSIEKPLDVCALAAAAGAPFVLRCSVYDRELAQKLVCALQYPGFSVVDVWGPCTGRFLKRNPLSPKELDRRMAELPAFEGPVPDNARPEFGAQYRTFLGNEPFALDLDPITPLFPRPFQGRREAAILGAAGRRIVSAGAVLCRGAMLSGLWATQKNEYDITVMRGPSVTEVVLSLEPIEYTGMECPEMIAALASEGVAIRRDWFPRLSSEHRILRDSSVAVPETRAQVLEVDFQRHGVRKSDRALACLGLMARMTSLLSLEALVEALKGGRSSPEEIRRLLTAVPISGPVLY